MQPTRLVVISEEEAILGQSESTSFQSSHLRDVLCVDACFSLNVDIQDPILSHKVVRLFGLAGSKWELKDFSAGEMGPGKRKKCCPSRREILAGPWRPGGLELPGTIIECHGGGLGLSGGPNGSGVSEGSGIPPHNLAKPWAWLGMRGLSHIEL